jgi:hypothetical protein
MAAEIENNQSTEVVMDILRVILFLGLTIVGPGILGWIMTRDVDLNAHEGDDFLKPLEDR